MHDINAHVASHIISFVDDTRVYRVNNLTNSVDKKILDLVTKRNSDNNMSSDSIQFKYRFRLVTEVCQKHISEL